MQTIQLNITLPDSVKVSDIINALRDVGIRDISTDYTDNDFIPMEDAMSDIFPDMTPEEIAGELLKAARKKAKLTQTALAELAGTQKVAISEMEKSKRPISKTMAKKLANVLDVNYRIFL